MSMCEARTGSRLHSCHVGIFAYPRGTRFALKAKMRLWDPIMLIKHICRAERNPGIFCCYLVAYSPDRAAKVPTRPLRNGFATNDFVPEVIGNRERGPHGVTTRRMSHLCCRESLVAEENTQKCSELTRSVGDTEKAVQERPYLV